MPNRVNQFLAERDNILSTTKTPLYGSCTGKFNLIKVPATFLEPLLPEKLILSPTPYTQAGEHPLLLMFDDVHLRSNIPVFDLNLHYNEFIVMIPYVKFRDDNLNEEPDYCFLPVLYLDNLEAIVGGRTFWDFNKSPAHFEVTPDSFDVSTFILKHTLFSSVFTASGPSVPATSIDNFRKILPILNLPVIEDRGEDYKTCWYKIEYQQAFITPLVSQTNNSLCDFFPRGITQVPSIADDVFGGFLMEYKWSLTYLKPRSEQYITGRNAIAPPQKIAVLGGGLSSITAVYKLTEDPDWQTKYDITVYQIGWRLGGKCASGRNKDTGQRIEEHGLHLWFGFYDNAFDLIQQCYRDNNLSWRDAFAGFDFICLEEEIHNKWNHWPFTSKKNEKTPGHSVNTITKHEYTNHIVTFLKKNHETYAQIMDKEMLSLVSRSFFNEGLVDIDSALTKLSSNDYSGVETDIAAYNDKLKKANLDMDDFNLRHFYILADFFAVIVIGMAKDKVISQGFNAINRYDFKVWLSHHGAAQITVTSAIVQAVYGLVFGGRDQYSFEAGTALRGLLRLTFTYKGNVYYRMLNGMGDVVFAPFYEVLKKRGVKFNFFNKVTNLKLDDGRKNIRQIEIDVQATVVAGPDSYNPLINVKGSSCWPSLPDYTQLKEEGLEKFDLESYYLQPEPSKRVLNLHTDFDKVILGISIGALPSIAKELIDNSTAWQKMTENILAVPTVAFQLWLNRSTEDLGWPYTDKGLALLGSYQQPYDTWSDMSQLIPKEMWPPDNEPSQISYFCGPTPQTEAEKIMKNASTANFTDPNFPVYQKTIPYQCGLEYLNTLTPHIWPHCKSSTPGVMTFDFDQLVDLNNGTGIARYNSQFFRHNIDPTELYVMSLKDTSQYRLKTDQNGYDNLYITGDWIDNGLNAGCVEATVMSGLQAARAVSGVYFDIPWENDI